MEKLHEMRCITENWEMILDHAGSHPPRQSWTLFVMSLCLATNRGGDDSVAEHCSFVSKIHLQRVWNPV